MDTALDLLNPGSPTEVSGDKYTRSYSVDEKRFICTVCGEYVSLRTNGYFYHRKRTEDSLCDLRVESKNAGNSSIYYRVGLPIYLRRFDSRSFRLYMGFYALSNSAMSLLIQSHSVVRIEDQDRRYEPMVYNVNNENFSCVEPRLIPISFIPQHNYKITVTDRPQSNINTIWSDYADTMSYDGALFTHHNNGGRKIRRGDSIETGTEYYLVTRYKPFQIKGMSLQYEGLITLQSKQFFQVYIVKFDAGEKQFSNLRDYCLTNFKVNLVYKKPRIIPLWPPVIQQNGVDRVIGSRSVLVSVDSQNLSSQVYVHDGKFTKEANCVILCSNTKYLKVSPLYTDSDIAVTIDRRFSLETTMFRTYNKVPVQNYPIAFDSDGQNIDSDEAIPPALEKVTRSIRRDIRVDIISSDGKLKAIPNDKAAITGVSNGSVLVASKICTVMKIVPLRKIRFTDPKIHDDGEKHFYFKSDPTVGCMVVLPAWAEVFITNNLENLNFKDRMQLIFSTKTISLEALGEIVKWRNN